jgi:hypothetical protein
MMSMAPLLIHSLHVPATVRDALRAAYAAPADDRKELLESAAKELYSSTDLECRDAMELVGIAGDCSVCQ